MCNTPVTFGGGILFFPIAYFFGDILTEVYGYAYDRRAVWAGFAALAFAAIMAQIVIALPVAPGDYMANYQQGLETVFGNSWRIALASMFSFWCGSLVNSYVLAKMKIWTPAAVGKYFFGTTNDKWRPYVGFGVSRVSFHNVEINRNDSTVLAMAGTSAAFSSSWVPVYNAGAIYNIDDKWSINGSVSYLPIKTTATFVGSGAVTTGDAKLNTTDYVIRLGYRF